MMIQLLLAAFNIDIIRVPLMLTSEHAVASRTTSHTIPLMCETGM